MTDSATTLARGRTTWARLPWLVAGGVTLGTGVVGIFVPLLPTTPFVLLAAFCFSRGCERCERWMLEHPGFGPVVRHWRSHRVVPLRAKQFATVMMVAGCAWAFSALAPGLALAPAACCTLVGAWLWRLPSRPVDDDTRPEAAGARRDPAMDG